MATGYVMRRCEAGSSHRLPVAAAAAGRQSLSSAHVPTISKTLIILILV